MAVGSKRRVLLAIPGLDGHDRGAKLLAHALKEAGFEVIYLGLHQSVEMIVESAIQEDVDVIGLCIMSGAHIPICQKLFRLLHEQAADDIVVLVGGAIPSKDIPTLRDMGVAAVFPSGSAIDAPAAADGQHARPAQGAKRVDGCDGGAHDRLLSEAGSPRLELFDVCQGQKVRQAGGTARSFASPA